MENEIRQRFFLDTEFIERGHEHPVELISIGIVAEDGREFYAEVEYDHSHLTPWLIENVVPHLQGGEAITRGELADEILSFVGNAKPEFWGYYADYDWVVFCQIFGSMIGLPKGWPMFCRDIKQLCVDLGNPTLPRQASTEHNALADAKWNRDAFTFLRELRAALAAPQDVQPGYAQGRLDEFLCMKTERPIDPCYWDMHHERELRARVAQESQAHPALTSTTRRGLLLRILIRFGSDNVGSNPRLPEVERETVEAIEKLFEGESQAAPSAEPPVRNYAIPICDQCIRLEGEMCHNAVCRFCRRTMAEVGELLDTLLIRPVVDGERFDLQYAFGCAAPVQQAAETPQAVEEPVQVSPQGVIEIVHWICTSCKPDYEYRANAHEKNLGSPVIVSHLLNDNSYVIQVCDCSCHRDKVGQLVREAWVSWAKMHPSPKPTWLLPYEELNEVDKEADRCIGSRLLEQFINWIMPQGEGVAAPSERRQQTSLRRFHTHDDTCVKLTVNSPTFRKAELVCGYEDRRTLKDRRVRTRQDRIITDLCHLTGKRVYLSLHSEVWEDERRSGEDRRC